MMYVYQLIVSQKYWYHQLKITQSNLESHVWTASLQNVFPDDLWKEQNIAI